MLELRALVGIFSFWFIMIGTFALTVEGKEIQKDVLNASLAILLLVTLFTLPTFGIWWAIWG